MTTPPNSPTLLGDLSESLRALAEQPETDAARAEVEAALGSKWWSLRVVAIRVVGRWGGKVNKAWLIERALRAETGVAGGVFRHGVRQSLRDLEAQTAGATLRPLLGPDDVGWLLELWFSGEPVAYGLHGHIMTQMAPGPIENRITEEFARKASAQRRLPLFWLVRSRGGLPRRAELLRKLAQGRDEAGMLARFVIEHEAQAVERQAIAAVQAKAVPKNVAARRAAQAAEEAAAAEARRLAGKKGRR